MKAVLFPGQGSQFVGMGEQLIQKADSNLALLLESNEILGFDIKQIMSEGTEEMLKETKVTQPAVFIYSYAMFKNSIDQSEVSAVAGHSLGEITALVANGTLGFEDGLRLVSERALAMQDACEEHDSTMAAILGLDDAKVLDIASGITNVVAANFNCPGQVVISGGKTEIQNALQIFLDAGARRAIELKVGGAFHSPYMKSAEERLRKAIDNTVFNTPSVPIYQNVNAEKTNDASRIKENLIAQLTSPVLWTKTMEAMVNDGIQNFAESGAKVLSGFLRKFDRSLSVEQIT